MHIFPNFRRCSKFISLLFNIFLPITLNFIGIANLILDARSSILRFCLWITFFVLGLLKPNFSIIALIFCFCLFENATLYFHHHNQFIIEFGVLGFIAASFFQNLKQDDHAHKIVPRFLLQPLVLPGLFSVMTIGFSFVWQLIDLDKIVFENLSYIDVFKAYFIRVFDWDVTQDNFFHPSGLLISYLLNMTFLWTVLINWKTLKLNQRLVWKVLMLGSYPVYFYALLQYFKIIPLVATTHLGGTFQNSNHLSFYAGLMVMISIHYLLMNGSRSLAISTILASLPWFIYRISRTSFVALVISILCAISVYLWIEFTKNKSPFYKKMTSQTKLQSIFIFGISACIFYFLYDTQPILRYKIPSIFNLLTKVIRDGNFEILWAGGRLEQFNSALTSIKENFWFGNGIGNFYIDSKSQYELHYPYLFLLYGSGIFGLITLLFGLGLYLTNILCSIYKKIKNSSISNLKITFFNLILVIYIAISHTLDTFISYRSLLYVITLIFMVTTIGISFKSKYYKHLNILLSLTFYTSIIVGIFTFWNFKNRLHYDMSENYPLQPNLETPGILYQTKLDSNTCFIAHIGRSSEFDLLKFPIDIFHSHSKIDSKYSFKKMSHWIKDNTSQIDSFNLPNQGEKLLCLCSESNDDPHWILIKSPFAKIEHLEKGYFRLRSFNIKNIKKVSYNQKFKDKKACYFY